MSLTFKVRPTVIRVMISRGTCLEFVIFGMFSDFLACHC